MQQGTAQYQRYIARPSCSFTASHHLGELPEPVGKNVMTSILLIQFFHKCHLICSIRGVVIALVLGAHFSFKSHTWFHSGDWNHFCPKLENLNILLFKMEDRGENFVSGARASARYSLLIVFWSKGPDWLNLLDQDRIGWIGLRLF
jgi:hypothetical protein